MLTDSKPVVGRPTPPVATKSIMAGLSVFDLFKIGIGPSSSHTVGPMKAAGLFLQKLKQTQGHKTVARVLCKLHGSLGSTGKGHGSDKAVMLGLMVHLPDQIDVALIPELLAQIRELHSLQLGFDLPLIRFVEKNDLLFFTRSIEPHPNGIQFIAYNALGDEILSATYFSIGGGFVREGLLPGNTFIPNKVASLGSDEDAGHQYRAFTSADQLVQMTRKMGVSISEVMRQHERRWQTDAEINLNLLKIWQVMQQCVDRGCMTEGFLPGKFKVKRRAHDLFTQLNASAQSGTTDSDPLHILDWVNLYALSVSEENAAGGRVVTAPTNCAAGIIPAVLHYYYHFIPGAKEEGVIRFLLTAGAIGFLYKMNASISGAEVGCQGEVGVACSMASGALCEILGGTPEQVENAAEIAMEHHLGLTCDPVGGLVQIPCIERNAIASVKAINAARMALRGDGTHKVSLDQVIKTMWETGADMRTRYKETSRGGLAVNVVEC